MASGSSFALSKSGPQRGQLRTLLVVVMLAVGDGIALAHPLAPALLELHERADGTTTVRWKTSLWKQADIELEPVLPSHCRATTTPRIDVDNASATAAWTVDCGPGGLTGAIIGVGGVERSETDVLLRLELADGRSLRAILRGDRTAFTVPERGARSAVMRQYAALGLEHILGGIDHLLFVFGLVLLVPARRALVRTVTAFTAGHSVTLSLAALGYSEFPTGAIEVLIALTIFALAIELARPRPSVMRRRPWVMAFVFGLLHGFGFAGALQAIGLPAGEIPAALFAFNVGIEIGQLIFVAVLLVLARLGGPVAAVMPVPARQVPVYAMGSLAAFWFFERVAALL